MLHEATTKKFGRRWFMVGAGSAIATAAAVALVEPFERKIWQVPSAAPVGQRLVSITRPIAVADVTHLHVGGRTVIVQSTQGETLALMMGGNLPPLILSVDPAVTEAPRDVFGDKDWGAYGTMMARKVQQDVHMPGDYARAQIGLHPLEFV